jgi:hypothetical protein
MCEKKSPKVLFTEIRKLSGSIHRGHQISTKVAYYVCSNGRFLVVVRSTRLILHNSSNSNGLVSFVEFFEKFRPIFVKNFGIHDFFSKNLALFLSNLPKIPQFFRRNHQKMSKFHNFREFSQFLTIFSRLWKGGPVMLPDQMQVVNPVLILLFIFIFEVGFFVVFCVTCRVLVHRLSACRKVC